MKVTTQISVSATSVLFYQSAEILKMGGWMYN
jgi:hypothetical protein